MTQGRSGEIKAAKRYLGRSGEGNQVGGGACE